MPSKIRDRNSSQLVVHSRFFKDYLVSSSEIKSDRHANSSRTKKAREKLLKLSTEQFSELSTDVYDELKRRESDVEKQAPHLPEDSNYHPKRNQARKKLASLPPSRFKDLVTDMLYEIERRGLDKPKPEELSPTIPPAADHSTTHIGVQTGTVIPTKSTLAWSSDEEEEEEDHDHEDTHVNSKLKNDSKFSPAKKGFNNNRFSDDSIKLNAVNKNNNKENTDESLERKGEETETSRYSDIMPQNKGLMNRLSNSTFGSPKPQVDESSKDREIELLLTEGNKMDKTITLHEKTIENLKSQIAELEEEKENLTQLKDDSLAKVYSLEREVLAKQSSIEMLENEKSSKALNDNSKVAALEQEIKSLQFTIKNLETEKATNEEMYLELRDRFEKADNEHKLIIDDYKVLQEKYNAALLGEDEIKDEIKEERVKSNVKIRKLEDDNKILQDQLEMVKAQLEVQKSKQPLISNAMTKELSKEKSIDEISKIENRLSQINNDSPENNNTIEGLKLQILGWQKKYQDLRHHSIQQNTLSNMNPSGYSIEPTDLSSKSIEKYADPTGLISSDSVIELNSLITSFLLIIHDDDLSTDLLFETITKITIVAGNIATEGESVNNGEFSALIKASVSHAITTTRFYAVHGKTLPKLVVETAISEISFSVCNLIAAAKVGNDNNMRSNGNWSNNPSILLDDNINDTPKSIFSDDLNDDSSLNAKPLRMVKRDGETKSPIITKKRENPFTTNFTLSPNIIGKPNKFSSFDNNNNSNNGTNVSSPENLNYSPRATPGSPSGFGLKSATGIGLKNQQQSPIQSSTISKRTIINTFDTNDSSFHNRQTSEASSIGTRGSPLRVNKSSFDDGQSFNNSESKNSVDQDLKENSNLKKSFESRPQTKEANVKSELSTPKKNSISDLKAKFLNEVPIGLNDDKNEKTNHRPRIVTPSNSILSRMKQLESSSNSGSPTSSPHSSPNQIKPSSTKAVSKFGGGFNTVSSRSPSFSVTESPVVTHKPSINSIVEKLGDNNKSIQNKPSISSFDDKDEAKHHNNFVKPKSSISSLIEIVEQQTVKKEVVKPKTNESFNSNSINDNSDFGFNTNPLKINSQEVKPKTVESFNSNSTNDNSEFGFNTSPLRFNSQEVKPITIDSFNSNSINDNSDFGFNTNPLRINSQEVKPKTVESFNSNSTNDNSEFGFDTNPLRFNSQEVKPKAIDSFNSNSINDNSEIGFNTNPLRINIEEVKPKTIETFNSDSINDNSDFGFNTNPLRINSQEAKPKTLGSFNSNSTIKHSEFGANTNPSGFNSHTQSASATTSETTQSSSLNPTASTNNTEESYDASTIVGNPINTASSKGFGREVSSDPSIKSQFAKPNTNYSNDTSNSVPSPLQESKRPEKTQDFDIRAFDIADPDNTLAELLLYLEHQTVEVISTIQTLLSSIKTPDSTTGTLKQGAKAIGEVVGQMFDATSVSMAQSRNVQLREHGRWVVQSLADCGRRMEMLCGNDQSDDDDYADKHFKQRLAGIAFDIAKCTKELVKTVEEASLKEEIAVLDARLHHAQP